VKPEKLDINNTLMEEAVLRIKTGIIRKLAAARKMIDYDKEVAAGIYIYALEELGKLELLKESQKIENGYQINYKDQFLTHKIKFSKAVKYLQKHDHPECVNIGGSFSKKTFNVTSFTLKLETNTEARLGIFYVDFEIDKTGKAAKKLKVIPITDERKLRTAIDGLEDVIGAYNLSTHP
jgi:hypothetical protein